VPHDRTVGNRDQGQKCTAMLTKRIDDPAFLLLIKGLSIHVLNGSDIAGLLVSDFNQVVLGLSAERAK
jgi:hypothetical protein